MEQPRGKQSGTGRPPSRETVEATDGVASRIAKAIPIWLIVTVGSIACTVAVIALLLGA